MVWNGNFILFDVNDFLGLEYSLKNKEPWEKTIEIFKCAKSLYASELENHFNGYLKLVDKNKTKIITVNREFFNYAYDYVQYLHFGEALEIAPYIYNKFGVLHNENGSQASGFIHNAMPLLLTDISTDVADIWSKLLLLEKRDPKKVKIRISPPGKKISEVPFTIKCDKIDEEGAASFLIWDELRLLYHAFQKIINNKSHFEKLIKDSNLYDKESLSLNYTEPLLENFLWLIRSVLPLYAREIPSAKWVNYYATILLFQQG